MVQEEQAVIDRIVDGAHAVLLIGPEQTERVVPVASLPVGAAEGCWLRVRLRGDTFVSATWDEAATKAARQRIETKLDRLRRRGRPSS